MLRLRVPAAHPAVLSAVILSLASATTAAQGADLQFNRDIRPLLSENCLACHGPDPGSRKAGLRLDTRESLFGPTKNEGSVVVPGKPEESALWKRIVQTDPDEVMPPPNSHKELKADQKELLRQWIAQGAPWQPHWSFVKPERSAVPGAAGGNPIDAFVEARLAAAGLTMNPEADRQTLARRVALDLTGLPPQPGMVEEFLADTSPNAYERYVQRLMDTPQWGEHRARYWLDAARYADTHGLHFDNYREMWPYRDWVIRAFNRNQPFDQFVVEQIAGDLLPNPTQDQLVATGFHRCNMTTNEGGTIEEENLVGYANDRVTTTGWVFLGLTTNCGACHDHKFDPFTMRDFYSMAAFFRNTEQSGFDGNVKDGANASMVVVSDPADLARWTALPSEIDAGKESLKRQRSDAEPAFVQWVETLRPEVLDQTLNIPDLAFRAPLNDGNVQQFTIQTGTSQRSIPVEGQPTVATNAVFGPAPIFGKGVTARVPDAGDVDHGQPFSFGTWVLIPANSNDTAAIVARMDPESAAYRGWDLWIQGDQFATHLIHSWPENALKVRTQKRLAKKRQWQHVFVTYDGSGKADGVKLFVDGVAAETEVENGKGITGSLRAQAPLTLAQHSGGSHFNGVGLQDLRIYTRALRAEEVTALAQQTVLRSLVGIPVAEWKPEARAAAFESFLTQQHVPYQDAQKALARLEQERESLRQRYPVTHIQKEKPDSKAMAAILFRGQYDKPRDSVEADVPAALNPLPSGAPRNRLGLAQWLVSPENPLMARVTVNRFWQELFGTGLVKTTEDFGIMGDNPANPELLDWLAVEFRESGWDVKRLFRLMVLSKAYRQDARTTPGKLEKDPANRLLSRGPRFRMDAEMVRDYALAASGLLVPKIGGPSVKPYQPEGVWEAVAMPESNTKRYQQDTGEALYRRSLYTFWKRAAPPATMDVFNAPSREVSCTRRERTNTPLQALATLNDPQFVEAARHLAESCLKSTGGDSQKSLDAIARRLLVRPLSADEREVLNAAWTEFSGYYTQHPEEARKLIAVGESQADSSVPAPQLAAMTLLANQLLNLDEVLNK
jgi:mono/diheme cytochrome c family protein